MTLDKETITLIAAISAAVVGIFGIIVSYFIQNKVQDRVACAELAKMRLNWLEVFRTQIAIAQTSIQIRAGGTRDVTQVDTALTTYQTAVYHIRLLLDPKNPKHTSVLELFHAFRDSKDMTPSQMFETIDDITVASNEVAFDVERRIENLVLGKSL